MQRGGVELDELDVGHGRSGPQGHGHAVAGGLQRVGRDRVQLSGAAGGDQDVAGADLDAPAVLLERHHPDAAAALDEQIEGEGAFEQHGGGLADSLDQRPLDLDAGGGTAGVEDAGVAVSALASEQVLAPLVLVEHGAHRDELVDACGALVDQDPHRLDVAQAGAGLEGVGEVEVGGVGVAAQDGGHAALGPAGGRLRQLALGEHADPHAVHVCGPDGGGEAGDAGTEHQEVERVHAASLPQTADVASWDGDAYQRRFDALAATGTDMHGEAAFVRGFDPTTVLDAGCGTGRVAIELARHGIEAVGVDVEPSMLATASERAPEITWAEADLRTLDLGRRFDVVVMAGNVVLFTPPGTQAELVAGVSRHVAPGGVLVAGFSTGRRDRPYDTATYDAHCRAAGLELVERFSTWDREPWTPDDDYAVSVHHAPRTGDACDVSAALTDRPAGRRRPRGTGAGPGPVAPRRGARR